MKCKVISLTVLIIVLLFSGCGGAGDGSGTSPEPISLKVGSIDGPDQIYELSGAVYGISATGDTGISYLWTCDPPNAGQFIYSTFSATGFTASKGTSDSQVEIKVVVGSDNCSPVERVKVVNIIASGVTGEIDIGDFLLLHPNAYLKSPDGQFLGNVNANAFDADSIANQFGTYGSKFSHLSIWNAFGTYGSQFSSYSPWNQFALYPPVLYDGMVQLGYLTINTTFTPRMNPQALFDYLDMD